MIEEIKAQWEADEPFHELACPYCGELSVFCDDNDDMYYKDSHIFWWDYSCDSCGNRWSISYDLPKPTFIEK